MNASEWETWAHWLDLSAEAVSSLPRSAQNYQAALLLPSQRQRAVDLPTGREVCGAVWPHLPLFSCADINGIAQRNWDFLANYSTWIARLSAKAPRRDSSNRRGWSGDNTVARLQERGATVVTADDTNIWEPKF